ncbi:metallophosphoesterase family protein [Priestia koreensis]|uniref:Phosphoesterase n=1 Tax=Priestia koreensis TaxID=284581 RepID=A0A0M0L773_9BACI|nr:metallophosphoesterase [Priestia koreensis]KOO46926.1 metallophosphatase [Priestia koreensis]
MKVLIVSDSHGLTSELLEIKTRHENQVDGMIHCGDSELPADMDEMQDFWTVRGNCDYDSSYVKERIELVGNRSFYITHGHLYNVKMSLMNLTYKAQEVGAHIACFGHSHIAGSEMIDGIIYINPGSIFLPRMRKERTYAIIDFDDQTATVHFYTVDGAEVPSLRNEFTLT